MTTDDLSMPRRPPAGCRFYLSHCHDDQSPGKTLPDGWSERRLARAVNEAIDMTLREEGLPCWTIAAGTLSRRIESLRCLSPAPVVEVHFDSLPQRTEVAGYFAIVDASNREAAELGESILDSMAGSFPDRRSLGLCRADEHHRWIGTPKEYDGQRLALLHDLPGQPVVIVEAAFLTNPGEAKWIRKLENRLLLGVAIGRGVTSYLARSQQQQKKPSPAG